MLKVGGENVSAIEVEGYLVGHPAVSIAQVVAAPDAKYGEVAAAFVQLKRGASATEEEIIAFCQRPDRELQGPALRALRRRVADVGHEDPEVRPARGDRGGARCGRSGLSCRSSPARAAARRRAGPTTSATTDWRYGVERGWLEEMVRYWADEWDWPETINADPQFVTEIDGVPIHFLHVPGDGPPLLLTHGWPWTYWDYARVIEELRGDFELVVPSLPGYGFSAPLRTTGVHPQRIAELWVELMRRLGHDRFAAGGGDWGAIVTAELGAHHAEHLLGVLPDDAGLPRDRHARAARGGVRPRRGVDAARG